MSFIPTKVRPAQADAQFEELAAAAEAGASLTKLEVTPSLCALEDAPQLATVDALSETNPTEPIQYATRRERREAERAIEAQARVEAFAESLRAARVAKTLDITPFSPSQVDTFEIEIPESFRAQWKGGRTRTSRVFAGRNVSGSTVALGLMAGAAVIGTGSAAAFAAAGSTEIGEATATVSPETASIMSAVAPEQVAAEDATVTDAQVAAATAPEIEVTSVTAFDADTVAGLAVQEEVVEEATTQAASGSTSSTTAAQAGIVWPVGANASISSYYGPRTSPTAGASSWHEGVDFTPGYGAAVGSMAAGTVVATDYGSTSYGNYIDVEHTINGQTILTRYAHLSSINVSVGQSVAAGETIGNVGNTGVSTGAHLHLEVHVNGSTTDPLAYLQANA